MAEDVFHNKYRELTHEEKDLIESIKNKAQELYELYSQVLELGVMGNGTNGPIFKNGREVAVAKTKLEESVMWAVKGLTK